MLRRASPIILMFSLLASFASAQDYRDRGRDRDRDRDRVDTRRDDRRGPEDWVRLGCRDVDIFGADHDTFPVGRRDGRFSALRLHVRNGGVEIIEMRVIYSNGDPDRIPVERFIRSGDYSEPLDLRGRERSIDRIEMTYRSMVRPADIITGGRRVERARVCVQGLQRDRDRDRDRR